MEGTNTSVKEKTNISSQGVFLALIDFICYKAKHSSYWRKTVFLISTDFICCEVKNSCLQGEKNHAFDIVPFLERSSTFTLPGLQQDCYKVNYFLYQLLPVFIYTVTEEFPQVINSKP